MSNKKITVLIFATVFSAAMSVNAQQKPDFSRCMIAYENHNQIDYGPLVLEEVRGTITDTQQFAVPKVCVALFTETEHKLVVATESDAEGRFALQSVPPGRYRLVVKADPPCAANVPLQVAKRQRKKRVLQVHMKPRGLDSCSYAKLNVDTERKQ